jgi:hypothetical protein
VTAQREFQHPRFAQMHMKKISDRAERLGATDHRRQLLEELSGRVIEIGSGHGLNFRLYPPAVTEVVAVDPDGTLRELSQQPASAHVIGPATSHESAMRRP